MRKQKWWKKPLLMTGIVAGILWNGIAVSAAGTVNLTADQTNVQISDTVTFSVQTSEPEDAAVAPQIQVTYDPQILEYVTSDVDCGGGGGLLTISSTSAKIQFKALAQGTANVSVEAFLDEDGNSPATGSASVAVGALQNSALSSDATLRGLSVNPGTLSPAFSPSVTDYTIQVGNDVTDITVSGGVSDENAQITAASGFKNLKEGENQAVITITAQDGSTLTYHFTITREGGAAEAETETGGKEEAQNVLPAVNPLDGAGGSLIFRLDDVTYQVSRGFDSSLLPEGCVKQDVVFQGQTVEGAYFEAGNLTLVYAISGSDGSGDFYICSDDASAVSLFIQIQTGNTHYIVPVRTDEKAPAGFTRRDMQWNNSFLQAYQVTDTSDQQAKDFYLLYGVDQNGTYGYYLYDALQGTCQRFLSYASPEDGTGKLGSRAVTIIGMLAIVIVGLLMVILNLFLRNKELAEEVEPEREEKKNVTKKKTYQKTEKNIEQKAEKKVEKKAERKTERKAEQREEREEAQEADAPKLQIEITDVEDANSVDNNEQQDTAALEAARKEEKQKAARKAALEKEIARDEKARAKREAVEKKKQLEAQRQAARQAEKQALAEQKAKEKLEAAEKKAAALQDGKIVVKKEVTDKGVTYTTGQIPITVVSPEKPAKKRNPVPIYTLERRTVSLTREAGPDELDDDFEFEFINIDKD